MSAAKWASFSKKMAEANNAKTAEEAKYGAMMIAFGIVGAMGFPEAKRLQQVNRELRFGFCAGGAPADMIKGGLELAGVNKFITIMKAEMVYRPTMETYRNDDVSLNYIENKVLRDVLYSEKGFRMRAELIAGYGNHEAESKLLMKACEGGYTNIVRLLLECGADPNYVTRDKADNDYAPEYMHNALFNAVHFQNEDITLLLLEHGADPMMHVCRDDGEGSWNSTCALARAVESWSENKKVIRRMLEAQLRLLGDA